MSTVLLQFTWTLVEDPEAEPNPIGWITGCFSKEKDRIKHRRSPKGSSMNTAGSSALGKEVEITVGLSP